MSFYFSKEGETQLCTPGQVSSDKADSLGVRFEFMKEGQHHWNKSADWSELSRIHNSCRILTPTKFHRWTEETGLGVKREKKYIIGNKTTCWVVYDSRLMYFQMFPSILSSWHFLFASGLKPASFGKVVGKRRKVLPESLNIIISLVLFWIFFENSYLDISI